MAGSTHRFGLTTLDQPTDRIDLLGYKFGDADRVALDRLLRFAVENHTHTGTGANADAEPPAPEATLSYTGGALPANATLHYRYSLVDSRGQELLASQPAMVHTPAQVPSPTFGPRLAPRAGSLDGGDYLYAVTACTTDSTQETLIGPIGAGNLPTFGGWDIYLPPMPSGGEFFNVYRKGPRDNELVFLRSTTQFDTALIDAGATAVNPHRPAPRANTTNMTSSVYVGLPASIFDIASGSWTWRLYRTFDPTNWVSSLLEWIGPLPGYRDDGRNTRPGAPPRVSGAVGGAPKIRPGIDTEGTPPTRLAVSTREVDFSQDVVVEGPCTWRWINDYDLASLVSLRATLGRDCPPAAQDVHVGIDLNRGAIWEPVTDVDSVPLVSVVAVGETIGTAVSLEGALPDWDLILADELRAHIYQSGGGATPTDRDLNVVLTMRVQHGSATQSYQWETT